jgi:hypothetical protein
MCISVRAQAEQMVGNGCEMPETAPLTQFSATLGNCCGAATVRGFTGTKVDRALAFGAIQR